MPGRLVLVRHAKTEQTAASDRERRLTERGHRQAAALGTELVGLAPVHALVSAAVRARQTWDGIAGSVGSSGVEAQEALYTAGREGVLDAVRAASESAVTVLVVGHNPTIAELAWSLADEQPGAAFDALQRDGYSPSTATVFAVEGTWERVAPETVTLSRYIGPLV